MADIYLYNWISVFRIFVVDSYCYRKQTSTDSTFLDCESQFPRYHQFSRWQNHNVRVLGALFLPWYTQVMGILHIIQFNWLLLCLLESNTINNDKSGKNDSLFRKNLNRVDNSSLKYLYHQYFLRFLHPNEAQHPYHKNSHLSCFIQYYSKINLLNLCVLMNRVAKAFCSHSKIWTDSKVLLFHCHPQSLDPINCLVTLYY